MLVLILNRVFGGIRVLFLRDVRTYHRPEPLCFESSPWPFCDFCFDPHLHSKNHYHTILDTSQALEGDEGATILHMVGLLVSRLPKWFSFIIIRADHSNIGAYDKAPPCYKLGPF